jgi:hypothetical protein
VKTGPIYESVSATIPASGTTQVRLGPNRYGISWHITRIVVTCTTPSTQQVTFVAYRGFVSPTTMIGGTYSGQQDNDDCDITLGVGDLIVGTFTGANAGDVATMTFIGTFTDVRP